MKAPSRNYQHGMRNISNVLLQIKDGFDSYDPTRHEIISVGQGDIVEFDGNANGASYLRISKNPMIADTETAIAHRKAAKMPMRVSIGESISQNIGAQEMCAEMIGCDLYGGRYADNPPAPIAISSLSQATTTLTVNTSTSHGLVVGDRIDVYGCVDSRLNYSSAIVATTPTSTQFTVTNQTYAALPSVTSSPAGGAFFVITGYGDGDQDLFGIMCDGTSASNALYYMRRKGGTEYKSAASAFSTNFKTAIGGSTSSYAYTYGPAFFVDILSTFDQISWQTVPLDSTSAPSTLYKRTQNIPDEDMLYRPYFRAKNRKAMSVPVGKIAAISKAGTTTATVTTDVPHGLSVNDYVTIHGVRDQTNFANLTTATVVASIVSSTQFTIVMAAVATATSYGGTVSRINGGQVTGANAVVVQSIASSSNVLTVVGNTTWAGIAVGDTVYLHGLYDTAGTGYPQYEGSWKVAGLATKTLTLVSVRSIDDALALGAGKSPTVNNLVTTNMGGTLIKQTDFRIHFLRVTDYAPMQADIVSSFNRLAVSDSIPVYMTGVGSMTVPVAGAQAANSSTIVNPTGVGVIGLSANPTVVTTGRWANMMGDLMGRPVVQLGNIPQLNDFNRITVSTTTETVLVAAVASVRHCLRRVIVANRDTVACTVDVRDTSAGTVRETYIVEAGKTLPIIDEGGWPQGAVNTNWTVQLRAATTTNAVEISAHSYRLNY